MIKPLLITSLCAFVAAAGFFSLAAASGVAHGNGDFWRNMEHWDFDNGDGPRVNGDGPTTTRTLAWPGGEKLEVAIGADVTYTQGPNAGIVATGPKGAVENLIVRDGELRFDRPMRHNGDLKVVMTAPDVKEFHLLGSHNLSIRDYKQDRLEVGLAGSGDVDVHGETQSFKLGIAGSGDVDAADLKVADAKVSIAGSGDATVGPTKNAEISIAGSGDVELTSHPDNLKSSVMGSGSVTTR